MSFLRFLMLLVAVAIVGCGRGAESVIPLEVLAEEDVKVVLEQIAEIGVARGEFGELLDEYLGEMHATDPQKAEALEQDAKELMSMSSSEAVKAKAREMLAKLEALEEE